MNNGVVKKNAYGLRMAAFIAGFCVMVIELTATRLLAPYVGSSLYTWTSAIGILLAGMAVGNYFGGRIIDKHPVGRVLGLFFIATAMATLIIPMLAYFSPVIALSQLPLIYIVLALSIVLFFIPAVCFGLLYPAIMRLYIENVSSTGERSGQISAAWTVGSIIGTFLTGFYFIGHWGSTMTVTIVSIILLLTGFYFYRVRARFFLMIAVFGVGIGAVTLMLNLFTDARNTVFATESDYYKIRVADRKLKSGDEVRALFLDMDSHSMERLDGKSLDTYTGIYPVFLSLNDHIHTILTLGGGSYTIAKNFTEFYKGSEVTAVEIDPTVQKVAEDHFHLDDFPIQKKIGDGRVFLNRDIKKYDLIFSDVYNSFISIPWYMTTVEFDRLVKARLNPGGIYAINVFSAREGDDARLFQSVAKTFGTVFGKYYVFAYNKDARQPQNSILVGINGSSTTMSDGELRSRIAGLSGGTVLSDRLIADHSTENTDAQILTDDYAPTERLMTPLIDDYFPVYAGVYYSIVFSNK